MATPASPSPAQALRARWAAVAEAQFRWKMETLPHLVTAEQGAQFDGALMKALNELPPRKGSGLAEFQRLLARRKP